MTENEKITLRKLRNRILEMKASANNHSFESQTLQTKSETIRAEALRLESIVDSLEEMFNKADA